MRWLLLLLLAPALAAVLLLPRSGAASPSPDAWQRAMVIHRHGIELSVRSQGAPAGCLLVAVRDLGPGVPGLAEDLPPTDAALQVNGRPPVPLEPAGPGQLQGVLPLVQLRPWVRDSVRLSVDSDARRLVALDLDLLLP